MRAAMMVSFLLFGMWVDDTIVVTADLNMYESWFLPAMNERFITNDMGEPPMMLGVEMEYERGMGRMYLHHHSSITRMLKKYSIDNMKASPVPCTTDLFKRLKAYTYTNTEPEAQKKDEYHSPYRTY